MKSIVTLLGFCITVTYCSAQILSDSIPIDIAWVKEDSIIISKTALYIDTSAKLSISEILQKNFSPLSDFKKRKDIPTGMITYSFYLKILVLNSADTEKSAYLSPGTYFKKIALYKINDKPIKRNDSNNVPGFRKFTLGAGELSYVLIQLEPLKNDFNGISPKLVNESYINNFTVFIAGHKYNIQILGFILSGVLFMMILFMVTNFIISFKPEFIYNALYSLCMFLLIFFNSLVPKNPSDFTNFYYSYFDFFLLATGTIFYISFTRKFLNTKINYPNLEKILKYGERFIMLLLIVYTILNFFTDTYLPQFYLENIMKFIFLGIGVAFIYLAFKQHNRLLNYIAAGNAMLVFFSLISFAIILFNIKLGGIFSALFFYYIGIVSELAFFLLGLTFKNRSELIQKIKEQEAMKLEAEKQEFEMQIAVIKAQQEERNRISADMHDDLGAGMTTIRLYSELAKSKLDTNQIPEIDKISSSANELLNKMNAIIWSMSSSNDSLGNMIAYIRSYALEYFEDTGIKCRIDIPENLPNIQVIGEIRRNVFLVVKEALNNILKHANASEVNITLVRTDDRLTLYIQDNGKGIDFDSLRQFGNGLKNMKKRMADVDIEFSIENNNGTLVTLHRKVTQF